MTAPKTAAAERALVLQTLRAVRETLGNGVSRWVYAATFPDWDAPRLAGGKIQRKPNPELDPALSVAQWIDLALRCEESAKTLGNLANVARIRARQLQEAEEA